MIVSIEWLKEFVDINETAAELADLLTNAGLEAAVTGAPSEIPGVVIGTVETAGQHPDADKLKLCTVNDGNVVHQVVCGAPNVEAGQTIAFAKVGSVLPGNSKLKKVTIRGVESSGMICSERELQITDEHEGIMVLPSDLNPGDDFISAFGHRFISLELDITPNRPDAFSHQGVARDIACATGRKFTPLTVQPVPSDEIQSLTISMANEADCPRYIGGIVKNVQVGPSPEWIVERLKASGQRSINNIVDISNYVLLEMGHPTHIFDYEALGKKQIHVRRAKKGESLTTLDEQTHTLDDTHLLITDGKSPVALAGVMGGLDSAVSDTTTTVLVESAYFNPVAIRKSAKSLAMSTDASKRFERGADPDGCLPSFWRVISMLKEFAGGELISGLIDQYPNPIKMASILMRRSELDLILGISIAKNDVDRILGGLGVTFSSKGDGWECTAPTYRPDITREIDLIEEIARIHGYDSIPSDEAIYGTFRYQHPDPEKNLNALRTTLAGFGFHQVYANSLQNEYDAGLSETTAVKMVNPLNREMGFLRTSLLPGLMKAADFNIKRGTHNFRLFELSHIHIQQGEGLDGIEEQKHLAGIICGQEQFESVHSTAADEDLFNMKGYLSGLFENKYSMRMDLDRKEHPGFDYAQGIMINRQTVGAMGRVSRDWIDSMDLDLDTAIGFEINLEPIMNMLHRKKAFKPISAYPIIPRDLNLVMPKEQGVGVIIDLIFKKGKKLVVDAKPVNIFIDPEAIGEEMKSVTFSITFQHTSKTLEDKDVTPVIEEIIRGAEKEFLAKLRT